MPKQRTQFVCQQCGAISPGYLGKCPMKPPKSATRKTEWLARAAAATALIWAVLGVLWAQVILLPHPLLPPPSFAELLGRVPATTRPDRFIVMLFKETSLLLTAYALLGMCMCTLAGRAGARKTSLLATLLCVTIAVASLVPRGTGYQDLLRRGRAALSRDISPTSLRYRNASRIDRRKPYRTPIRGARFSRSMSGNRLAKMAEVLASDQGRTYPRRGGRR